MPRRRDPQVRSMLLERTAQLLRRREPVTLRSLVAGTDVSSMAVYTHFGSMEGLWAALRQEGFTRLAAGLDRVPQTHDPVRDLAAVVAAYCDNAIDHPDLYRVMFDATIDLADPVAADGTLERLVLVVRRGVQAGRFRPRTAPLVLATRVWMLAHGMVSLVATGPLPDTALQHGPPMLSSLLSAAGDDPVRCRRSVRSGWRPVPTG